MKKNKKAITIGIWMMFISSYVFSQNGEVAVPLLNNPYIQKIQTKKVSYKKQILKLPFFDDFSYFGQYGYDSTVRGVWPYDTLWDGHQVFINATMGVLPPSVGVATFDGLNEKGEPYQADAFSRGQPADTLTSKPIDLSSLNQDDSTLYLSFFYQPQGNGDAPEFEDSLQVEALDKAGNWKLVWHKSLITFKPFALAMVNLKAKDSFFHSEFRFRFMNTANLSGNLDHWHIDYVYLNNGRSKNDTNFKDQAFVYLPRSVFKDYTAIPARHFYRSTKQTELFSFFNAAIVKNNYVKQVFPNYRYVIKNMLTNELFVNIPSSQSTTQQINPRDTITFNLPLRNLTKINQLRNPDTLSFVTKNYLIPQFQYDSVPRNDSCARLQTMSNYYAYDDGSAELGYGLITGAGKVALRFNAISNDSIQGILMRFNRSKEKVDTKKFKLTIWENITPVTDPSNPANEKILYQSPFMSPIYQNGYTGFVFIPLDKKVYIKQGEFYVGWYQEDQFVLNVGLDANYSEMLSKDKNGKLRNPNLFYITSNSWVQTAFPYTLMIRPVVGPVSYIGIQNPEKEKHTLKVYPNPSSGQFTLQDIPNNALILINDMKGKNLIQIPKTGFGNTELNLSNYPKGIYYLTIVLPNGLIENQKLIVE